MDGQMDSWMTTWIMEQVKMCEDAGANPAIKGIGMELVNGMNGTI